MSAAFARCDHHDVDPYQHHNHDPHPHNNHHHDHRPWGWQTRGQPAAIASPTNLNGIMILINNIIILRCWNFTNSRKSKAHNLKMSEFQNSKKITDRTIKIVKIQEVPHSTVRNFKISKRHDFKKIKLLKV